LLAAEGRFDYRDGLRLYIAFDWVVTRFNYDQKRITHT